MIQGREVGKHKATQRGEILRVTDITGAHQYGYGDNSGKSILCMNEQGVHMMDTRVGGREDSIVSGKTYKSKVDLTCVRTTTSGFIVTGAADGAIRLYTKVGQRAKTLFPGNGTPIKALDISLDEEWILATTAKQLIVLSTRGKDNVDKNGFKSYGLGQDRHTSRILKLTMEDQYRIGINQIDFRPATFNLMPQEGGEQVYICSGSGQYVILWNFKRVKRGETAYKLHKTSDHLVGAQFMAGTGTVGFATAGTVSTLQQHK
ncbi:vacuolar import/degradation, Vid27-related [Kipferlia bialata]|uniref:Vacuolar import/degradation, Vid27-related n=1 Tax=Kipferlia bialata TaxID=797122 RepID=A0A9K3D2V0_9EUKA|nr:vacuolar import/degradation, Vid27-related [Kipferlia bialata]|eukprot:g9726.t1